MNQLKKKLQKPYTKTRTLRKVFTSLNKFKKGLDSEDAEIKVIEESLKKYSSHEMLEKLDQLPRYRFPKRKNLLKKELPKNDHNKSLEEMKKILDEDTPTQRKFITAEIFQKKSFFHMLKLRKRQFGFASDEINIQDYNARDYPIYSRNIASTKVSKKLNAILYNNIYRNSQRSKRNHIEKSIESGNLCSQIKHPNSESSSPVPLQILQIKLDQMRNDTKILAKEFKLVVNQASLEADLMKLKISKRFFITDAF